MATGTNNLNLQKFDDDEGGWGGGHRGNWDLLDDLYAAGTGNPNGVVVGKQNQIWRQTDTSPHSLWVCTLGGSNNSWVELGEITSAYTLNSRNTWTKNQSLTWRSTTSTEEALSLTPTQDDSWIYVGLNADLTINIPTGYAATDAQPIILELERVTSSVITVTWDAGFVWALGNAPTVDLPSNVGDVMKVLMYYSPALNGVWRAEYQLLDIA